MFQKERLLAVLNRKGPDRLPWFADLNYWHFSCMMKNEIEEEYYGTEGLLSLHKKMNVGYYLGGSKPLIANYEVEEDKKTDNESVGYDDLAFILRKRSDLINKSGECKGNDINTKIETPFGIIKSVWKYSGTTFSWAPTEYFIKSDKDLKAFTYWIKNTSYKADYDNAEIKKELIGDLGFLLGFQPRSPLMQLITVFAGLETTINLWLEKNKIFNELIEIMEWKSDEAAEIVLKSPSELIMIPENLSSDMVGKKFFKDYLEPYEKKWNERIKKIGKYSLIHMDGYLKGLLSEVSSTSPSAVEAITPKPVGDLAVDELKDFVQSETVLWGGIPGPYFTDVVSEEDFKKFVFKTIKIMVSKPSYVLGIGDQLPPDGIIKRVMIVSEMVDKHGFY